MIRVAEMFAGVGGFRLGLEGYGKPGDAMYLPPAGGFETVWANQWEPPGTEGKQFAWRCYEERFGAGSCVNRNIEDVLDDFEAGKCEIPDFDLLVGGFPCFPAGTPVLTDKGYRPIENVEVGMRVLTHKGRFMPVVKRGHKRDAPLVEVKAMGSLPIKCTPNHPFMVRERTRVWNDGKPHFEFGPLIEKSAEELMPGRDFVLCPSLSNAEDYDTDMTEEEAWLIGRYIADGYSNTMPRKGRTSFNYRMVFCVGEDKADEFESHLVEYNATRDKPNRSVVKFTIFSKRLLVLAEQFVFGYGALNKAFSIPALTIPHNLMKAMLDGYESGDGSTYKARGKLQGRQATTVSVDLARTLSLMVGRVYGKVASVTKFERPETYVIEGRTVNQHDTYTVRCKTDEYERRSFYEVDGENYAPVKKVTKLEERAWVYNFEVEEDHTYVVENLVVHNCQDYSVSKPAPQAKGIEGRKGVLWWSIQRMLELKRPKWVLLENVDRLLKSPTAKRGRDFAIMLSCLAQLGYTVEWKVVNAADFGFPQRRKRVYIFAEHDSRDDYAVIAKALPGLADEVPVTVFDVQKDPFLASRLFGNPKKSPFLSYGRMWNYQVVTYDVEPAFSGVHKTIRDILVPDSDVPDGYFISPESMERWEYLKGAKREPRTARNGHEYVYSEGPVAFPDDLDKPSRTILTSEGGSGPSRMKHVVRGESGRLRRLVPEELERLQGFPSGWTEGMSDSRRAFCMGNALVVGIPHAIGAELAKLDA